jgi:hypothetical protein
MKLWNCSTASSSHRAAASASWSARREPGASCYGPAAAAGSVRPASAPAAPFAPRVRLIRGLSAGLLRIAERARGITMRNQFGLLPLIRQGGWRATAAQECAASRLATRGSHWPGAVSASDSGRPRIPGRRMLDTPAAYFIGGLHCGASGELNVTAVPGQCVMQNNKVRRRSSSQRRERDLGRGA